MLIDQTKKNQCMKEIEDKLPELMSKANIAISQKSYPEFLEIVKNSIKSEYFPGFTGHFSNALNFGVMSIIFLPLTIALFPLWILLYPALAKALPLIRIPEDCGNQELKDIPQNKLNSIGTLIEGGILVSYRDYVTEARLEKEAEENRLRWEAERKAAEEKQHKIDLADNGLARLQKELTEAQRHKKYEEAAHARAAKDVTMLQDKIAQLKAKDKKSVDTNNVAKQNVSVPVNGTPKPELVSYYFQSTRLSTLESLVEDHDGNPVIDKKIALIRPVL